MGNAIKKDVIHAEGIDIGIYTSDYENEFISLTDIAKKREGEYPGYVIQNWMRNRSVISFIGLWEALHNPNFNCLEFEAIKNEAGDNNPIIPKGQEKDVQRGVYYGLTGRMSDALDKLAPKVENIIRNLAEMCGDLMTYYDVKEGIQQKKVLSQIFAGVKLNECIDENIIFTFDGLLQQKAGSNIRNRVGHGLNIEAECSTGDCIYFVMIALKFCALYSSSFMDEIERRR